MVKFLIHKPLSVIMSTILVVMIGLIASKNIPISLMPDIDIPEITINIDGTGLSARELEDVVASPLRSKLAQLSHLDDITSKTFNGHATIKLSLTHGTDLNYAFVEVNELVDQTMPSLPSSIQRPQVIKSNASSIPILHLDLTLKNDALTKSNEKVTEKFIDFSLFVDRVLRKRIEQIPEVAMVDISGMVQSQILVLPFKDKLNGLELGVEDIEAALMTQNVQIDNILVKDNQYQYNLYLGSPIETLDDLKNIYLNKSTRIFQLKELAEIKIVPQQRTGLILSDGKEAISLAIIKQTNVQIGQLKNSLDEIIKGMRADYPNIDFKIKRDQSRLLNIAIGNLKNSLLWGLIMAFAVMITFLKDSRSPVLIAISIPLSVLICILAFYLLDISINIISLSGLIMGIGLMIDNAIIVIDNISQYRQRGEDLSSACIKGVNDIIMPLLASVLTTCAVFIPLIFLSGIAGDLFYDQAMAITIGLFASFLVSITLLPVLYRLLHKSNNSISRNSSKTFIPKSITWKLVDLYETCFLFVMRKQKIAFSIVFILILSSTLLAFWIPKSQLPNLTTTEALFRINWNSPINVYENKSRILDLLNPIKPSIKEYTAQIGNQQFVLNPNPNVGATETTIYVRAGSPSQLKYVKDYIKKALQNNFYNAILEIKEETNVFNSIFPTDDPKLTAEIKYFDTGETLLVQLKKLWRNLEDSFKEEVNIAPISLQEFIVFEIDREKLLTYGIETTKLEKGIKQSFNKEEIFSIILNQQEMKVLLGTSGNNTLNQLERTLIRSNNGSTYPLNTFVKQKKSEDLKTIFGSKSGEYIPLNLNVREGMENGTIQKVKNAVIGNHPFDVEFSGSFFKTKELIREMILILIITLLILYFILASQFESLLLPIIILLEIPVALSGSLGLLAIFDISLNLMSMIGIVVMSGIIINDSILKIDTINQLIKNGNSLIRSLFVAGQRRLNAILMTSLTTILALTPILWTKGIGGELQTPLAIALIGGMFIGTLASLFIIPLMYYHLHMMKK